MQSGVSHSTRIALGNLIWRNSAPHLGQITIRSGFIIFSYNAADSSGIFLVMFAVAIDNTTVRCNLQALCAGESRFYFSFVVFSANTKYIVASSR